MNETLEEKIKELKSYINKIDYMYSALAVFSWDDMVNAPRKAVEYRSSVSGHLAGEVYKLKTSEEVKKFIDFFDGVKDELDEVMLSTIDNLKKDYYRTKKIPDNEYQEYTKECSISLAAWQEAKNKSDFNIFKPHLKKILDFNKKFVNYWGYEGNKYNALLDDYEPGITTERLDKLFEEMKNGIMDVLNKIKKSGYTPRIDFFGKSFS
ncbi:hypothetical protein [Clostridium sp. DMHC 10]|uniref:hypothetical protein n=1 Tax=Clostridium sp. DMHC 10 TaxID=747377 RepID=UPI000B15FC73